MAQRSNPRGRPPVGERVAVRLPPEILARVDAQATARNESRAASIRRLLAAALDAKWVDRPPVDGVDRAQIRRMLALTPRERIRHMAGVANGMARFRDRARQDRA